MMPGKLWVGVVAVRGVGVGRAMAKGSGVAVGEGSTCGGVLPPEGPLPSRPCSSKGRWLLAVEQPSPDQTVLLESASATKSAVATESAEMPECFVAECKVE